MSKQSPSSDFITPAQANKLVWNYAHAKNGGKPFSLIFEAAHTKTIIDGIFRGVILAMEKKEDFEAFAREATHVRMYLGLGNPTGSDPTGVMVGVKLQNGVYKDLTDFILDMALPCPPHDCGDPTSAIVAPAGPK